MSEDFSDFMVYELRDSGERIRLNVPEKEFRENHGRNVLHSKQVAIIIKNKLRRMFIWKGYESSVRKKFIASRVAVELQSELIATVHFHRCKIVSVDQGEEPQEFLDVFGFDGLEILNAEEFQQPEEYLDDFGFEEQEIIKTEEIRHSQNRQLDRKQNITQTQEITRSKPSSLRLKTHSNLDNEKQLKVLLDKIIQTPVPKNSTRKNILVGNNLLYGETIKRLEVFGEKIEEREWEPVSNLPKEMFELEGHKLRFHFNNETGKIEAVEILEQIITSKVKKEKEVRKIKEEKKVKSEEKEEIDYNKWTVKQLKSFCSKNNIKVPSSYRKANIVKLVEDFNKQKN